MKIVVVLTLAVLSSIQAKDFEQFEVQVAVDNVVNDVDEEFIGLKFSADIFRDYWKDVDTSSKQLISLAKGLQPSLLKIGGTAAQRLIFKADGDSEESREKSKQITLTGEVWEKMYNFVHKVGWKMMFDFNHLLRKGDRWDYENAKEFLKYSEKKGFSIPYFLLGNEPNSYDYNFNVTYSGTRLAKDMKILRKLLSKFQKYKDSKLVGPDVTRLTKKASRSYLDEFLQQSGWKVVYAVGLHHYYISSHGASLHDMINTTILNTLNDELCVGNAIVKTYNYRLPVWLTETSSLASGGLPNGSNRYVAGFMWLDKLGLSALYGVKTVIRQTFMRGGRYSLLADDFFPYPDYFLTLLYKRLVKGPVFKVISSTNEVRAYASCANTDRYKKGALTVYILNLKHDDVQVNFRDYPGQTYDFYLLEPGDGNGLTSAYVKLNGEKLLMVNEELPDLPPLKTPRIVFPSNTFGFIVIPDANVEACKHA